RVASPTLGRRPHPGHQLVRQRYKRRLTTATNLTMQPRIVRTRKGLSSCLSSVLLCVLRGKKHYFVAVTVLSAGAGYCGSFSRGRLARCISSSPNTKHGPP